MKARSRSARSARSPARRSSGRGQLSYSLAVFSVPRLLMRKTQGSYLTHTSKSANRLRDAAETIRAQNESLEQANRLLMERSTEAMESLSATVDARDSTVGHSRRVQQL